MSDWLEREKEKLASLSGQYVNKWSGIEMAIRETSSNESPIWYSDEIQMLQFVRLGIVLNDSQSMSLTTYQNDDIWGLFLVDGIEPTKLITPEVGCIFREREVEELPNGKISSAIVKTNENGEISELLLEINGRLVSFKAGEVYEDTDDSLRIIYMDESVLVQVDGDMPRKCA